MGLICQRFAKKVFMTSAELKKIPTPVPVVAAALIAPDGQILMHRRRIGGAHGGLWEFPGGKVEAGESKDLALIREIAEELGVTVCADTPCYLASAGGDTEGIVIDLYTVRSWIGEPQCLEGEEIAWFAPDMLAQLAMPPLDVPLAQALRLALKNEK